MCAAQFLGGETLDLKFFFMLMHMAKDQNKTNQKKKTAAAVAVRGNGRVNVRAFNRRGSLECHDELKMYSSHTPRGLKHAQMGDLI